MRNRLEGDVVTRGSAATALAQARQLALTLGRWRFACESFSMSGSVDSHSPRARWRGRVTDAFTARLQPGRLRSGHASEAGPAGTTPGSGAGVTARERLAMALHLVGANSSERNAPRERRAVRAAYELQIETVRNRAR